MGRKTVTRAVVALALSLSANACGKVDSTDSAEPAEATEPRRIRLATTTSTEASGLLQHLLPPFEKRANAVVQVIAVGTGHALELGRRGDADVVLVHARKLEDGFVAQGYGIDRRDVMWNDFVILGPKADPAGTRGSATAAAALEKIRAAKSGFLSRGDNSGTHVRELDLWSAVGGAPKGKPFYFESGQGMGKTLTIADQKGAYALADRGTYLAFAAKLALEVLVEGDPALRNPYGMILVNPAKHPHVQAKGARELLDFVTSAEGQRRIGESRVKDKVLFHPASER